MQDTTRTSLDKAHKKLYCTPRYGVVFTGRPLPGPETVPYSGYDVDFQENVDDISPWETSLYSLSNHYTRIPRRTYSFGNKTQNNYTELIPSVYKYRLPSTLHYSDDFLLDDILPEPEVDTTEEEPAPPCLSRFSRPAIASDLLRKMEDLKVEMAEAKKKTQCYSVPYSGEQKSQPTCDCWINTSDPSKLALANKSDTQRR